MIGLDWINEKLGDFLGVPARLDRIYEDARQVFEAEARYRMSQDPPSYVQSDREVAALEAMAQIDKIRGWWRSIRGKLVIEERQTLGQVPVAVIVVALKAVTAIIIVGGIVLVLTKTSVMEGVVRQLRLAGATPEEIIQGMELTPKEKSVIGEITGGLTKTAMWLAIGAAAVFIGPALVGRRR